MKHRYLVIGAGAVGGTLAAYLHHAGYDVSVIARGINLQTIVSQGIQVLAPNNPYANSGRPELLGDNHDILPPQKDIVAMVPAFDEESYNDKPDVIFISVKDYSLDQIFPFIKKISRKETLLIPVLNSLTAGQRLDDALNGQGMVAPGIAYVAVARKEEGVIQQQLNFYTIVFGRLDKKEPTPMMLSVKADLAASGIDAIISEDSLQAALRKFFRVSLLSTLECAYNCSAGGIAESPERMKLFEAMGRELLQISNAIGKPLDEQPLKEAIKAVYESHPDYQTSLKIDYDKGRKTEFQAQIFDVVELGKKHGLAMEAYTKAARMLGYKK